MFKILAQINKNLLPSFSKQHLDLSKASIWQLAIISWRYYVTTHALKNKNSFVIAPFRSQNDK